ncbi:MAG: division plane positioning ATPase MipZ [Nitrosospira sp.]
MILLIGGEKGGTGKSTIATNLAVQLAIEGRDVMLLDADPQGTASKWIERRNEQELPVVHCTQKLGDIYKTAIDLGQRYEYVIVDAGGRDSKELRTGMVAADKMYIPIRASQADLETLPHVDELVGLARGMNENLQVFALLSMAPSNPLTNEVQEAQELLEQFAELKLSQSIIRDRKVYRDAMLAGKGVVEMNNSQAKAEIQLLCNEVFDERV